MKHTLTHSAVGTLFALGTLVAFAPLAFAEMAPWVGPNEPTVCTQEAKLCPDGSYVGRTGPNCEFAACPGNDNDAINGVYPTYGDDARTSVDVNGTVNVDLNNTADNDAVDGVYPTYGDDAKTSADANVEVNADGSANTDNAGFFGWVAGWRVWNVFGNDDDCGTNGKLCPNQIGDDNDSVGNNVNGSANAQAHANASATTNANENSALNDDANSSTTVENRGFFQVLVSGFLNIF